MLGINAEINWLVFGLLLLGGELFTGTFVMLLFAGAAFVLSLFVWLGIVESITYQLVFFGLLSGASLLLFKNKVRAVFSRSNNAVYKGDFGEAIVLDTDLPLDGQGEARYQGVNWTVVNASKRNLYAGESVKIVRVDGVKLIVS